MLAMTAVTAFAANESASVKLPSQVKPGEQFTVTVTFTSSEDIGSVKSTIEYDSDIIEFVSGDFANGGGGLCIINGWPDEVGKSVSFDLTFKAVSKGSTQLLITSTLIYNDLGDLMGKPVAAVSIEVSDSATTTPSLTTPSETVSSEISSSESSSATTTQPTATTTTTTTTTQAATNQGGNDGNGGDASQPDETKATDSKKPSSDSSSKADKDKKEDKESGIDKGTITTILLIVGAVLIVALLLTSSDSGSKGGKKRSSSSRSRSGSSRSSSQRRSSSNTRRKR